MCRRQLEAVFYEVEMSDGCSAVAAFRISKRDARKRPLADYVQLPAWRRLEQRVCVRRLATLYVARRYRAVSPLVIIRL